MTRPPEVDLGHPNGKGREHGLAATGNERGLAGALNTHTYPRALHTSRLAYRLFQAGVHLTTLRSWYVRRAIRRVLRSFHGLAPTILDVGCGSGDHLQFAVDQCPGALGIGIDRAADAIALGSAHSEHLEFKRLDVQEDVAFPQADVILCITVLQYIRRDRQLLARMRQALRDGGTLLLYVPVRNERILSLYRRIVEGSASDYDAAQDHRRVYRPEELKSRLSEAGFDIARIEEAYGRSGKLAFELHALLLHGLTRPHVASKVGSALATVVLAPAVITLMLLDYWLPVSRGNALLIQAR